MTNRCRPARARHLASFLRTTPTRGRDAPSRVSSQLVGAAARVRAGDVRLIFEIPAAQTRLVRYERECFSLFLSIDRSCRSCRYFSFPRLGRGIIIPIIIPISLHRFDRACIKFLHAMYTSENYTMSYERGVYTVVLLYISPNVLSIFHESSLCRIA
jgi:hypothetical protein